MAETRFAEKPKKKTRPHEEETSVKTPPAVTRDTQQKLKELDAFIDDVLEQAGEEFLEEFRQVEGE